MTDTVVNCTVSPCTVVLSFDNPLMNIDSATGLTLCASIVGAWAVGLAFRFVIRAINGGDSSPTSESD